MHLQAWSRSKSSASDPPSNNIRCTKHTLTTQKAFSFLWSDSPVVVGLKDAAYFRNFMAFLDKEMCSWLHFSQNGKNVHYPSYQKIQSTPSGAILDSLCINHILVVGDSFLSSEVGFIFSSTRWKSNNREHQSVLSVQTPLLHCALC